VVNLISDSVMVNSFFATVACGMIGVTLFISMFLLGFSFDTIDPNGEVIAESHCPYV
jgi:hypothetical protein